MDINSFLPVYPSLEDRKDNLYDLFPSGFYNSLYRKKELYQLQSDPSKPRVVSDQFTPQAQQEYASRYASFRTLYDNQLILHSMGVGKTALAILTVENNLGNGFIGGVIAVPSKKFIKSFITEILNITRLKYYPEKHRDMNKDELDRAIRKNIKKIYKFITFEAFANSVEQSKEAGGNTSEQLHSEYSNRVIIVDEAHNLRIQPDKKAQTSKVHSAFHLLFHSISNCKILLMTGTPMKDRWNELPDLANLILPLSRQLPSGNAFDQKYSNDGKQIDNEEELRTSLKGMVSALRTIPSNVKREFVGDTAGDLNIFKVDLSRMSKFQEEAYLRAYKADTTAGESEGIYDASRQAINFVFPDGSYGSAGFKKFMVPLDKKKEKAKRGTRVFEIESMNIELRNALRGATEEETLEKVSKYSCKYAQTIRDILEQTRNRAGNTYIYNSFVEGSGAILFARILELFGYRRSVTGVENTPGKRYALLTNRTLDEQGKIVADLQKTFNDPKNAQGDYIQVIIGSRTSGEGLSFYNVENIGVHTPYWNYASIDQAIMRGIRFRSHDVIEKIYQEEKKEFKVKIHHYVATPENLEESIDMIMYKRSEDKDIRIKRGERMLKEISYDCGNNRLINMRGTDGSRDCEYEQCEYKCEGLPEYEVKNLDEDSYNLYYSQKETQLLIEGIKQVYRKNFTMTFDNLQLQFPEAHPQLLLQTLKRIVDTSMSLVNKYGFKSYLREFNDTYFLVDNLEKPSSALVSYYTSYPAIRFQIPFIKYQEDISYRQSIDILDKIYGAEEDFELILDYWSRLPITVKELLLESVIDAEEKKQPREKEFRQWLLNLNRAKIHRLQDGRIVSTLLEGVLMCRSVEGIWKDCSDDETIQQQLEGKQQEEVKELEDNPFGYYGIINEELLQGKDGWKHGFWIKDLSKAKQQVGADKRKKIRGEKCSIGSLKIGKLASIAFGFNIDIPNKEDERKTSEQIRKILEKDNFITIDISKLSDQELRRFYRLYNGRARGLCTSLLDWFKGKKLIRTMAEESMK